MADVSDTNVFVWVTSLGYLAIIFLSDPLFARLGITVGRRVSQAVSVGLVALFFPLSATLFLF